MTLQEQFQQMIDESKRIVFFGGAGVSTESGIPDFRSEKGIYNTVKSYGRPPETILSHSFFMQDTRTFFDFYKSTMSYPDARPNPAHIKLAELEKAGKLTAVVTQNIDGLHQAAGSKCVYELHGSMLRNYCMDCGKHFSMDHVLHSTDTVPLCDKCGGIIKPDVVLYEEGLDNATINGAVDAIEKADMLIVGGTSLNVYPAAGLVNYYEGNKLVLINMTITPFDVKADLILRDPIGEVFSRIIVR